MSMRWRLLLASILLVLLPLLLLGLGVRRELSARLETQFEARVQALVQATDLALEADRQRLGATLAALGRELAGDTRFRLAAVDRLAGEQGYLLDLAGRLQTLAGLDLLQIQDADGRILSSGHFRNEYDRQDAAVLEFLANQGSTPALVTARLPAGSLLALAHADTLRLAGNRFWILGGLRLDELRLAGLAAGEQTVSLLQAGAVYCPDPALKAELAPLATALLDSGAKFPPRALFAEFTAEHFSHWRELPNFDSRRPGGEQVAWLLISQPRAPLNTLIRSLDRWLLLAWLVAAAGSLLLAGWLSARISRPLRDLAGKAASVDLDRLEVDFASARGDEVGGLARLLASMTDRLRASVQRLREAERRATLGEISRQVTHDIRNGLAPLRNVFRHFSRVAESEPGQLTAIFAERRGTVEASLDYLETLAGHYARLSPRRLAQCCDLNALIRQVLPGAAPWAQASGPDRSPRAESAGLAEYIDLEEGLPALTADPLSLRRIVENLLRNARESFPAGGGSITVRTRRAQDAMDAPALLLEVQDTGRGIAAAELERIFEDFYSSKAEGGGLGLSIVRRLVADLGGSVKVESSPGEGSCFRVLFPVETKDSGAEPTAQEPAS